MARAGKSHQLRTEIYKRGYSLEEFANICGIRRETLSHIFSHKTKTTSGYTINLIARNLGLSYENVEVMCNGV